MWHNIRTTTHFLKNNPILECSNEKRYNKNMEIKMIKNVKHQINKIEIIKENIT